jgi:galacturan 1,4-alpha-galacturonidase
MISIAPLLLFISTLSAGALAAPSNLDAPNRVALAKRATCTPASLGNTQLDDTPAIKAAITSCGNGGTIVIPAAKTYSLRTTLDFAGCANCDFQIEGTLKASTDTAYW